MPFNCTNSLEHFHQTAKKNQQKILSFVRNSLDIYPIILNDKRKQKNTKTQPFGNSLAFKSYCLSSISRKVI